jgi:hypothetical protein
MQKIKFKFELDALESDALWNALDLQLHTNQRELREAVDSDKNPLYKKGLADWYVGNTEWFMSICKKVGFEPNFDHSLKMMRELRDSLTSVEPDTRSSAESLVQEASAD